MNLHCILADNVTCLLTILSIHFARTEAKATGL